MTRNDPFHQITVGPVNLAQATAEQVQDFFNSFDVILSDCDGVIWYLEHPIPGAMATLSKMQELGKRLYLASNNNTIAVDRYCEKTRQGGLIIKPEQVLNTAKVVCGYLKKIQFSGEAFVISSKPFRETLINAGIKVCPANPEVVEGNAMATVMAVQDRPSVKAVIVDFSLFFDWGKLAFAISCLKRKDVLYLCGAQDEWAVYGVNKRIIGSGPLIDVLTKYSGRSPTPCAKPSEILRDYVLEACNIKDPKRCLFIGDSMKHDMKFGTMCGFQKLFVETGLDRIEDAEQNKEISPDYYIPSLALLNPILDSMLNAANKKEDQ